MKKNITVIGAGSAGWLSALYFKEIFSESNISVIADQENEIIGVGESTTPPILKFFSFLKIGIDDMIVHTGATIKNSIKFTNWNNSKNSFYHGFESHDYLDLMNHSSYSPYSKDNFCNFPSLVSFLALNEILKGNNLDDIHFAAVNSRNNKIPLIKKLENENHIFNFAEIGNYALHVNAKRLAEYLKVVAFSREIKLINDRIDDFRCRENGNVYQLITRSNQIIETDFIIDCSGFARLFARKFNVSFDSYKSYLPVNKAIPFFIENKKSTPPYTEAIAMKYGWMWKIPVEGRFGCGYVFDQNYITDSEARDEIIKSLNCEVEMPRVISFEPGYYKEPWTRNILSVGLSSGFIEPLEATSIWILIQSLVSFSDFMSGFVYNDEFAKKEYNLHFTKFVKSILSIVNFHYITNRNDTEFWKNVRNDIKLEELKDILEIYNHRLPTSLENYFYNAFNFKSWLIVGAGNYYFDKEMIKKEFSLYNVGSVLNNKDVEFKKYLEAESNKCIEHDDFLNHVRKFYNKEKNC